MFLQAKKVLQISEGEARNTHKIDYDERNPFTVCCGSLTPIYKGSPTVRSAYCNAPYKPQFKVLLLFLCLYFWFASRAAVPDQWGGLTAWLLVTRVQDTLCVIDGISMVGLETLGLVCQAAPSGAAELHTCPT